MPLRRRAALALPVLLGATAARAQPAWMPERPVRLIAPFPPGGTVDVVSRILAPRLADRLGQPVVVENRAGAGGSIGGAEVARARPDGLTLLTGSNGPVAVNPLLQAHIAYDPIRDLAPIGMVIRVPIVLVAGPAVPARSLAEFLTWLRARPAGSVGAGSPGIGSSNHLAIELFNAGAGVTLTHIPYRGAGPANADLIAGTLPVMFDQIATALPLHRDGRARILAVADAARTPFLPDVPTLAEAGIRDAEMGTFNGLLGPAGMPPEVVAGLARALAAIMAEPATRERLAALGAEVASAEQATPAGFAAAIRAEVERSRRAIALAGLKPE
ncbi:MAG: tripartite tricarboxylate transporter substrate binding protein [Acetobacteraceae bacterium]|nr:tripartite tricarboxylate transporter substrate binding protein [Acetobacteraceae bacterium]